MSIEEARKFEKDPLSNTSLALRKWDEMAKGANMPVTNLSELEQIFYHLLQNT